MIESPVPSANPTLPLGSIVAVVSTPVFEHVVVPEYRVYDTTTPGGPWNVMLLSVKLAVATEPEDPVAVTE
jgi:hypothetical protein